MLGQERRHAASQAPLQASWRKSHKIGNTPWASELLDGYDTGTCARQSRRDVSKDGRQRSLCAWFKLRRQDGALGRNFKNGTGPSNGEVSTPDARQRLSRRRESRSIYENCPSRRHEDHHTHHVGSQSEQPAPGPARILGMPTDVMDLQVGGRPSLVELSVTRDACRRGVRPTSASMQEAAHATCRSRP